MHRPGRNHIKSLLSPDLGVSRRSAGQALVEFALIVPVSLLLMGSALDLGRLFYTRVSLENAAREGAFYGSTNPRCDTAARSLCDDPDTAEWRVVNEATGLGSLNIVFSCTNGGTPVALLSCAAGDMYEATVSTNFTLVTPLLEPLLGTSMTLEASASAVVLDEAFDPNEAPQPQASIPPLCVVPDMIGMTRNDARGAWGTAGFVTQNLDSPGMSAQDIVAAQTIPAGWDEPCDSAEIEITE